MTTLTQVVPLTAEDVTAARIAEDVTFHTGKHGIFVRLYVRGAGDPAIFTAREQRLFTITDVRDRARELSTGATAGGYGGHGAQAWSWSSDGGEPGDTPACFHTMYDHESWVTIARSLRAGDTLRLQWVADNNNQYADDTGLHIDQLRLIAIPADTRKPHSTWRIGTSVCQDNSARMVRRHG